MKFFILFTLFCGIIAQETALPSDVAKQTFIANCKTQSGSTCTACHTGFETKDSGKTCTRIIPTTAQVPSYLSNGQIVHPEIGYDTKEGTCSKTVKIVAANGQTEIADKYSGSKSCLACAKFKADGKCEICATGYLENKGGCTPLTINPFGENDMNTNKNCIVGAYEGDNPKCSSCQDPYIQENNKCVLQAEITDTVLDGCIHKVYSYDAKTFVCTKCREGYKLFGTACKRSTYTPHLCKLADEKGYCKMCIPGYYLTGTQCSQCSIKLPSDSYFTGDECNLWGTSNCHCNPNCIRNTTNYATCSSRHCDLFSDTEMASKNQKNPKCLRCEQGYKLNADNECEACANGECKINDSTCEKGYYMTNENKCMKCEGRCLECISKDICKNQQSVNVPYSVAVNGLPCFDGNCKSCSTEDSSICFECAENFELIGGKCYQLQSPLYINQATAQFQGCRNYKQPEFVTNNAAVDFTGQYECESEVGYIRDYSKKSDGSYYCKHYDHLPHYYRNLKGNELTCAGKNRDIKNDCECLKGYYATSIEKTTDCLSSTFINCEIPINNETCAKCKPTMVLKNDGVQLDPELKCGCPRENMRINANGLCVDCPQNCAKCETVYKADNKTFDGVKCTKCKGQIEPGDKSDLAEKNYNRDLTKQCACLDGYVSHAPAKENGIDIIYSCYKIPENCKKDATKYEAKEYEVECKSCDKDGFTLISSCTECENAHYPTYKSDGSKVIETCTKCPPAVEGSDNKMTYCSTCSAEGCTSCVDDNLNITNKCRTCNEGYSMIFISSPDMNGNNPRPYCVKCPTYCNMEGGNGCYLAANVNENDKYKDMYVNKKPYEESILGASIVICQACYDGGVPTNNCQCGNEKYQDHQGRCHECKGAELGEDTFVTIDQTGTTNYTRKYNEVCEFNKDKISGNILSVCQANQITHYPECTICKIEGRDPSSNCTTCTKRDTFAMFDGTNHICKQCNSKCKSCTNINSCSTCVAQHAIGEKCDKCSLGYYVESLTEIGNSAKCTKCPTECSACESATKCTACVGENNFLGPNNDCKGCIDGYYFDYKEKVCKQIDVSKGFAESKPVCLDKNKKVVNCVTTPADQIGEVVEMPIRCDTSKGVGISPEPVNRTCVCDTGYLDNRTAEEKQTDPIPKCVSIKVLADDYFCVEGQYENGKAVCTKCNADYLQIVKGKCECKDTHYKTSWGSCIPCNRHNKGCVKCSSKHVCISCDSNAYNLGSYNEKENKRGCVGK